MSDFAANRELIRANPVQAHETFFGMWHENASCPAHLALIGDLWNPEPRMCIMGFRGFAKSTRAEEMVALGAFAGSFRFCLFIGPSEARASEHLLAVRSALEENEQLIDFCGEQLLPGGSASQTYLQLADGRAIVAMGQQQKLRGIKKDQSRPDLVIVDDFEDEDNVLTAEGRRKAVIWTLRTLRRACHPQARYRVLFTPMHPECVPLQLHREAGWPLKRYPCYYLDEAGEKRSIWPARFPMELLERDREEAVRMGDQVGWMLEMECDETAAMQEGDFRPEYIRVEPRVRVWEPVWIAIDPARTVGAASAATGIVVFSWVGTELIVWEDRTGFYRPSEILDIIFELNERYRPFKIAFEENGLELWASELIRAEAAKRGIYVPYAPVRAPRDKLTFIRGLEPHFRGRQVVFAGNFTTLTEQFLGFPRGRIDGPNALAYALMLRPGLPVYGNFNTAVHVADHILWSGDQPLWLALGASGSFVTGCLVGCAFGRTAVLADWLREGDPGAVAADIVREAMMQARQRVYIVAGPEHFEEWNNVGLCQAVRRIPAELRQGGSPDRGRDFIRRQLAFLVRDVPGFRVDSSARWTLSSLAAGYARAAGKPEPEPGIYRTLMESLESLLGLMALGLSDDVVWSYTETGQRYRRYGTGFEKRVH